jgi:N-acetylglucosaminyldiphosphoundecaprenol N-acetyl-beta-D-mannosaminyltransferase
MVKVLGISFYTKNIAAAVAEICAAAQSPTNVYNRVVTATGAHGLVEAYKDPLFHHQLASSFINLPDGMPTVWVGKLKGAKTMSRCYGPDFFMELIKASADLPIEHFFCGGNEGVAEALRLRCKDDFGNNRVVGVFCPPFRTMSDDEMRTLGSEITLSGAHIVWIGMSCPKQEKFAHRLANFTQTRFIVAVGAAFDFHTGRVKQAPKWMQNAGLEWFFRLLMEPKRLYKRYFEIVPRFIWLNIKEFVDFYRVKNKSI